MNTAPTRRYPVNRQRLEVVIDLLTRMRDRDHAMPLFVRAQIEAIADDDLIDRCKHVVRYIDKLDSMKCGPLYAGGETATGHQPPASPMASGQSPFPSSDTEAA